MRTVITYGTFDLFHLGHVRLLERISKLGDRLVVGLSTDDFNSIKGKEVIYPYSHRRDILLATKFVDHVFPETCWEQKRQDIIREQANVFAMGDDWAGRFDDLSDIVEVYYIPRTSEISSTEIKQIIKKINSDDVKGLVVIAENLLNRIKSL